MVTKFPPILSINFLIFVKGIYTMWENLLMYILCLRIEKDPRENSVIFKLTLKCIIFGLLIVIEDRWVLSVDCSVNYVILFIFRKKAEISDELLDTSIVSSQDRVNGNFTIFPFFFFCFLFLIVIIGCFVSVMLCISLLSILISHFRNIKI